MKKIVLIAFLASAFAGCLKGESGSTCNYEECRIVAPASEIQSLQNYLNANSITAIQHCSGLFYAIDQEGTGVKPTVCNRIVFNYVGRLTDGTVFDQSQTPADFRIDDLISGFKNGIPLIKKGGKIRLYVPPSLGYGSSQSGSIPPNSILIFNVELLDVR